MHELGYSRDQYYRRVRLLARAGVIHPDRGKRNELLLSESDRAILAEFRNIEQNNAKHSLEWCLEHLKAKMLQEQVAGLSRETAHLEAENRALRKALVKYRRWSLRRMWKRIRAVIQRGHTTHIQ